MLGGRTPETIRLFCGVTIALLGLASCSAAAPTAEAGADGTVDDASIRDSSASDTQSSDTRQGDTRLSDSSVATDTYRGTDASDSGRTDAGRDTASPPSDAPVPSGCKVLTVTAGTPVDGTAADSFAWSDSECQPRTAALWRNNAADALGGRGGILRTYSYLFGGRTRNIKGSGSNGWQGFGYIVNHFGGGDSNSKTIGGTYQTLLTGRHHAIHQFKLRMNPGGPVDTTVHWVFATGRSHPLFAVTFDSTPAGVDAVTADSRAPYGDLAWDAVERGTVDGVGWGDKYRFTTTSSPVQQTSSWSYAQSNTIPYALEWSNGADAEMGLVATQAFAVGYLGGDYGPTALTSIWGRTGSNLLQDVPSYLWPFQLNQYELPWGSTSHRVAWGTTYGAVGQRSYSAFGKQLSGYPYLSYTVAVVLGAHSRSATAAAIAEMEAVQGARLTATRGTVATDGPGGVGRTDRSAFSPAGFDPVYGAWTLDAANNAVTATLAGGPLTNPLIVLRGYRASSAPARVEVGGQLLTADVDYFATVDSANARLWLTLNRTLTGTTSLTIE